MLQVIPVLPFVPTFSIPSFETGPYLGLVVGLKLTEKI
jgi:hypothetical protein